MFASIIKPQQAAKVELIRAGHATRLPSTRNQLITNIIDNLQGTFNIQQWRNGKRINEWNIKNGIVNEGKDKLLNVMFDGSAQITTWYLGLIDNSGFTALASDDIYDDINQAGNGWDEFTTYTDANNGGSALTRPEWGPSAAASQSISNSTVAIYDITASGTVKGLFAVGGIAATQTKGDNTLGGTLWATALFTSGDTAVLNGDQLKVTYTVSV